MSTINLAGQENEEPKKELIETTEQTEIEPEKEVAEAEKSVDEPKEKAGTEKEGTEIEKEPVIDKKEERTKKEAIEEEETEVKKEIAEEEEVVEAVKEEVIETEKEVKEKIVEVKSAEQVTKEVEEIGIDTIDLEEPQGNWLFKRMWWEHAEERYEKIRDLVQKIWESRMNFFIKRTELDKTVLDPFYISIGIGQGELHGILSELVSRIEQEREEEGLLSQSERLLLVRLKTEQQTLEQTKFDVESISQLDHNVDEALNRLMEQINRVRAYEGEAWEYFKNIARVLNDKKARELFFKMDTVFRNLRDIDEYLQQGFTQHFNQLLQKIDEKINNIKDGIQRLKEKGIDFKKQLDNIEIIEEEVVREQEAEEKENEEEMMPGWGTRIWNIFVSVIRWPYEKLAGTEEANE